MIPAKDGNLGRRVRRWPPVAEKRQNLQLTIKPDASAAEIARVHGLNANKVFKWRREFHRSELIEPCAALLPVTVATPSELKSQVADQRREIPASRSGEIHIEIPG